LPFTFSLSRFPGVAYLLVVELVLFSIFDASFLSVANLLNVGVQSATLMLLALPMTLIIMSEGLDLSMGAVLGLAGVALATLLAQGHSVLLALGGALSVGTLFGLTNGALVVALGMPPFIATLGTLGVAQGLAVATTGGRSVVGIGDALPALYASRWAGVPFSIVVAMVAYAVFHVVLYHTRFGAYVFAIGGNREALRLAGVHARAYHLGVYAIGGAMAGLGALLLTARMNAGHPIAAIGMEFDAIAAVVVGGTSFKRGNGWLPGTLLGVVTIGVLKNGLNVLAVPSSLQSAGIGLLVIVALLIDSWRGRT
jgi:ribose transport system permease protein